MADTMRLKFRRPFTIKGVEYAAGKHEAVEITDEAWQAVNSGAADLDPLPGVQGQPHPEDIPDWVTRSEVPLPQALQPQAPAPQKPAAKAKHPPEDKTK